VVADSTDRVGWLRARSMGITATDAARLSSASVIPQAAWEKYNGRTYGANAWIEHGRDREPFIAGWMTRHHGIEASSRLFHAAGDRRHLATPDGMRVTGNGEVELAEIKTTTKAWRGIPRAYLRQVWWQQYVLGAERTLVVWEQHEGFRPIGEPKCRWVDRDDDQIAMLVNLADRLLDYIAAGRNALT
jgi:hypothetical protein